MVFPLSPTASVAAAAAADVAVLNASASPTALGGLGFSRLFGGVHCGQGMPPNSQTAEPLTHDISSTIS